MIKRLHSTQLKTTYADDPEIEQITQAEQNKDKIPAVISDPYCREILRIVDEIPKSAMELNLETRIPISTIYRRIQSLCDAGLLETSGTISEDGKKYFLYKSTIRKIYLKFDGSLQITVIPKHSE